MFKKILVILSSVILLGVLSGCSKAESTPTVQAPAYAATITETMLQAYNSGNYQDYSLALNEQMSKMTPEAVFNSTRSFIEDAIGTYQSKKLSSVSVNGTDTTVVYIAKFSKEPKEVKVSIVFDGSGDNVAVSGFWLESPKLWEH